jgi:predicted nucleic acid-binding protein
MSDTTPRTVVDASVAVKWFLSENESHVAEAWALLEAHLIGLNVLCAPAHLRLEVLNAMRSRRLPEAEIPKTADALEGFRLEWHPVDGPLARSAAGIAARHNLTLYDAAFAALALALDAELVTADRRLATSGACRARLLG